MAMSIDEAYLKFNDTLHHLYQHKAKMAITLVVAQDIKEHNKKFAKLLSKNMECGMPQNLLDGWMELFFKNLENIKPDDYHSYRKSIDNHVQAAFEIYDQYFGTYQEHFLPLREKEMLQQNIPASHLSSPHTHKI